MPAHSRQQTIPAHSRLAIIVFSGDYDRVHYALAMASAAAAVNRPTTLFFTMGALKALRRDSAGGVPGWAALHPAGNGASPVLRDAHHAGGRIGTGDRPARARRALA